MNCSKDAFFNRNYEWFPASQIPTDKAYKLLFWLDPHGSPHHMLAFYDHAKKGWIDTEDFESVGMFDFWCHLPLPSDEQLTKCVRYQKKIITDPDGPIYQDAVKRLSETTFPTGVKNPLKW